MTIQSPVNDKQEKNAGNFTEEDTKCTEFFMLEPLSMAGLIQAT